MRRAMLVRGDRLCHHGRNGSIERKGVGWASGQRADGANVSVLL